MVTVRSEVVVAVVPVLLAGGAGTRLWPVSNARRPKPFLDLLGRGRTLFQATVARAGRLPEATAPWLVVAEEHVALATAQAREVGVVPAGVVAEPARRNTAPALAAVAAVLAPDDVMVVLPCDHDVLDEGAWVGAVAAAIAAAATGEVVALLGVPPTHPATGFGYIVPGEVSAAGSEGVSPGTGDASPGDAVARPVARFVEKPGAEVAQGWIDRGAMWNAGLFVMTVAWWRARLAACAPDIAAAVDEAMARAPRRDGVVRPEATAFSACRADSIDYAVMEHGVPAVVVPLEAGWSDVGSWPVVRERLARRGEARFGRVRGAMRGGLAWSDGPPVVVLGADELVVVATGDGVLVAREEALGGLRDAVARLTDDGEPG